MGLIAVSQAMAAGIAVYDEGDKFLKFGGRIQLQYHREDPENGEASDTMFFRALRAYLEGSVHKDWRGKIQWEMGKASGDNEIALKDVYLQYKGFPGMELTIGNSKAPFSREFLISSEKQQLVERTFVGDHDFGSPDRMLGVRLDGHAGDKKVTYSLAVGNENIDPDAKKLDFDSAANGEKDWNEGWIVAGRVDFHPFGPVDLSQGDFKREKKASIGVSAFSWHNDGDNDTHTVGGVTNSVDTPDVDSVTGVGVSGALRGAGVSVDVQYNRFDAETVDPAVTSGLYEAGETTLTNVAIEGGYMVIPSRLELVAGYEKQDADNYAAPWNRTSFGFNTFLAEHDIKLQTTYRKGENLNGKKGEDQDELFIQMQYVF